MEPLTIHAGKIAALDRHNVDTDQMIPKQFLKRIERTGFGQFLFFDWRFLDDGAPNPEFELHHPHAEQATILIAGENFGSGSSREHAVWALADYGFRVIIAPSFADIFYNNCFKNGVLPIQLDHAHVRTLLDRWSKAPVHAVVSLEDCHVKTECGFHAPFTLDESRRQKLLQGLDDIGETLKHESAIEDYEAAHRLPSLTAP